MSSTRRMLSVRRHQLVLPSPEVRVAIGNGVDGALREGRVGSNSKVAVAAAP